MLSSLRKSKSIYTLAYMPLFRRKILRSNDPKERTGEERNLPTLLQWPIGLRFLLSIRKTSASGQRNHSLLVPNQLYAHILEQA